jgi:hypothetical protein
VRDLTRVLLSMAKALASAGLSETLAADEKQQCDKDWPALLQRATCSSLGPVADYWTPPFSSLAGIGAAGGRLAPFN